MTDTDTKNSTLQKPSQVFQQLRSFFGESRNKMLPGGDDVLVVSCFPNFPTTKSPQKSKLALYY